MKYKKPDFVHRIFSSVVNLAPKLSITKNAQVDSVVRDMCKINYIVLNSEQYFNDSPLKNKAASEQVAAYLLAKVSVAKVINMLIKYIAHRLFLFIFHCFFLLASKKKQQYEVIVKTWIDVNYDCYVGSSSYSDDFCVLILPFPLGVKRQILYLKKIFSLKVKYFPIGIPYSLKDMAKLLIYRDLAHCFEMEFNGALSFATLVSGHFDCDRLFVMDDVEPMSVLSNRVLKENNSCEIVCELHGVGTYSPYIYCDKLVVFNDAQKKYYAHFNEVSLVSILNEKDFSNLGFKVNDARKLKVLFLSGAATKYQDYYLEIELRVLKKLAALCDRYGFEFEVKLHPNSTLRENDFEGFEICNRLSELDSGNIVGCSLYSTSYYTFGEERSFLIETVEVPTTELFGNTAKIVFEDDLEGFFKRFFRRHVWKHKG